MYNKSQKYNPELGLQGNIEYALWEVQYRKNELYNEALKRSLNDSENRVAVEQSLTDQYLDNIKAQQDITDLYLEIIGG